jgi:hypothetical protein
LRTADWTLEEIKAAIAKLLKEDFDRLSAWITQKYQTDWDRRIEEDSDTDALDFSIREISDEAQRIGDLPPR